MGIYPGKQDAEPFPDNMSQFLQELNSNTQRDGITTYSLLSLFDEVHPYMSFSRYISEIKGSN